MKTLTEIKQVLCEQQAYLETAYGVHIVDVFGSYVRNEERADSDIDILVEPEQPPRLSLIDLVELEHYLGKLLETKVDIAIKANLRKRIGRRILDEVVQL